MQPPQSAAKASAFTPRRRRVWRPGRRPPPPLTEAGMVRAQLTASVSALDHPNESIVRRSAAQRVKWLDQLEARHQQLRAAEKVRQQQCEDETDLLTAQLDALSVMTSGKAFINAVDRTTLLKLLSEMRKVAAPNEPSPLTDPVINLGERKPDIFRIRPKAAVMDSGSSDSAIDTMVTNTITFAHRRNERLKQERLQRQRQRQLASQPHRAPPTPSLHSPHPPRPQSRPPALRTPPSPEVPGPPQHQSGSICASDAAAPPTPDTASVAKLSRSTTPTSSRTAFGLGLRWWRIGTEEPTDRVELNDAALSLALERKWLPLENKVIFTRAEFAAIGTKDVQADHFVRAGASFFSPTVPTGFATAPCAPPWRTFDTPEQRKRDLVVQTRVNSQYSLGLVQRLLSEHQVRTTKLRDDRLARAARIIENKRAELEDKAAMYVQRARARS